MMKGIYNIIWHINVVHKTMAHCQPATTTTSVSGASCIHARQCAIWAEPQMPTPPHPSVSINISRWAVSMVAVTTTPSMTGGGRFCTMESRSTSPQPDLCQWVMHCSSLVVMGQCRLPFKWSWAVCRHLQVACWLSLGEIGSGCYSSTYRWRSSLSWKAKSRSIARTMAKSYGVVHAP